MTSTRLRAVLAVAVSMLMVLAACSSNSDPSSPSSSPSIPSGPKIKLGMICSCTGPVAAVAGPMGKVVSAWAASVNEAGGINGHAVEVKVVDDGGNPATSLKLVKQLVEQDRVMAIVGQWSIVDDSWASYVADKDIPVLGGINPNATYLTNPNFFPSGSQLVAQMAGLAAMAAKAEAKHLGAMYCAEAPVCKQLVPLITAIANQYDLKITTAAASSTAPNYTAQCLSFKEAGVDALWAAVTSPIALKIYDGCAKQGYTPRPLAVLQTADNAWRNNQNVDGVLLSGHNPAFDASLPAIKAMQDALAKYESLPPTSDQYNNAMPGTWAGGKLFEAAAKASNIGPTSTGADVKKGLYALKDETLGGLSGPLNFTPGQPAVTRCYFSSTLKDGKFETLDDNKPTCLSETEMTTILGALKG